MRSHGGVCSLLCSPIRWRHNAIDSICSSHHMHPYASFKGFSTFVAGAPVVAYSTGKYPPGTNDSDVESTVRKRKGKGLKRSLTSVSSPQKSPQGKFPSLMLQDSQDPNATPPRNETPESPVPPPTLVAGAPPASSASVMPPPAAPAEAKDALYWKSFSLKWV